MASYSPQIIQVQPQPTILDYLGQGIQQGGNRYMDAMLKQKMEEFADARKEKKSKENLDKFVSYAKSLGKEVEYSMSPTGMSAKTVTEKPLPIGEYKKSAGGVFDSDKVADQIARSTGVSKYEIAAQDPAAAMSLATGDVGNINEQPIEPTPMDTRKYLQGALSKNPVFMPTKTTKAPLSQTFAADFQKAVSISADNPQVFIKELKALSKKYATDSEALSIIKNHINIQQEKDEDESDIFNF